MKEKRNLLIGGGIVGLIAVALVMLGNPKNMGFCIACFIRDIAGGVGMHGAAIVQYVRPEVIGLVVGAFIVAVLKKDFAPRGGSSPLTRFVLGFGVILLSESSEISFLLSSLISDAGRKRPSSALAWFSTTVKGVPPVLYICSTI